jgi:hypothetical protein
MIIYDTSKEKLINILKNWNEKNQESLTNAYDFLQDLLEEKGGYDDK